MQYKKLMTKILEDQRKGGVIFFFDPTLNVGQAYAKVGIIFLPEYFQTQPNNWAVFTTLHEVGHLKTYIKECGQYYREYLATVWAIEKSKEYKFRPTKANLNTYQKYIFDWRDTEIKQGLKGVHDKEQLILIY